MCFVITNNSLFAGNAGGYLGLFLGYALLNVPDLLWAAFSWIKRMQRGQNEKKKQKKGNRKRERKIPRLN